MSDTTCNCGRTHPRFPAVPFVEGVFLEAVELILAVVAGAVAKSDTFDEQFETQLVVDAGTAAAPGLLQLLPEYIAIDLAQGLARSAIASIRLSVARGLQVEPVGGRLQ